MARHFILKNQRTGRDLALSAVTIIAENLKIHVMDDEIYIEDTGAVPVVKINSYPLTPDNKYSIVIGDFVEIGKDLFRVEIVEQKTNTASATLPKNLTRVVVEDNDRTDPQITPRKVIKRAPSPYPRPQSQVLEKIPKAKFDPTKWVVLAGVLFLIALNVRKFALRSGQETSSTATTAVAAPVVNASASPIVSLAENKISPPAKAIRPLKSETQPLIAAQAVTMTFDPTEFLRLSQNIGERFPTGHHCPDDYAMKLETPSQLDLKLNVKKYTCRDYRSDRTQHFRAVMNENITTVSLEYRKPLETCDAEHLRGYFGTTGEVLKDGPVTWYSPHAHADWAESITGDLELVVGCESQTHLFWVSAITRIGDLVLQSDQSRLFFLTPYADYKMTPEIEAKFRKLAADRGLNSDRSKRILDSGIKESYDFK